MINKNINFTINLASKVKKEVIPKTNISRKCLAVVKLINGEFKAIININKRSIILKKGDTPFTESLCLEFTEQSLNLTNKIYVWTKHTNICVIRDKLKAKLNPGSPTQYNSLKENLLIAGYIINKNNKMYFEYEDLIAYNYLSEFHICDVKIDDNKPLFNK